MKNLLKTLITSIATDYFTKVVIEAMFKKEGERAITMTMALDLKLVDSDKVAAKQYPSKYKAPHFKNFDGRKGT